MKPLRNLFWASGLITALAGTPLATAQTAGNVQYKVKWEGSGNPSFVGAYAIIRSDGTTTTRSFAANKLPTELNFVAPATATVSASGGSLIHNDQIEIKIYRNGQLCDEALAQGRGNYATASCEPPVKQ